MFWNCQMMCTTQFPPFCGKNVSEYFYKYQWVSPCQSMSCCISLCQAWCCLIYLHPMHICCVAMVFPKYQYVECTHSYICIKNSATWCYMHLMIGELIVRNFYADLLGKSDYFAPLSRSICWHWRCLWWVTIDSLWWSLLLQISLIEHVIFIPKRTIWWLVWAVDMRPVIVSSSLWWSN